MSYSEPLANQLRIFFLSIGVGVFICLLYVVIQGVFRICGEGRPVYYTADTVFCIVFAFVSFFFMVLYNSGRVRLHLIIGEGIGFFVFYLAVGKYILAFLVKIAQAVRKIIGLALLPVISVGRHFVNGMGELKIITRNNREGEQEEKKMKKIKFISKIHLKNRNKSV